MSRVDVVGIAKQTVMGTAVTTMEYFVPVETSSVNTNQTDLTIDETIGNRFATPLDYGTRFFDVPMAGAPRASSFPRILSGFLGVGVISGTYTHTYDPTVTAHVPLPHSIFIVRNDPLSVGQAAIIDLFYDALGNELQVDVAANDYAKMSAAWIALHLDGTQAAPTPTYDSSPRFKFYNVICDYTVDDGTTWTPVTCRSAGFTYQNNLDTDEAVLGSRELYGLPYGNADAEVRFSTRSDMVGFYRRALAADPVDIGFRITCTDADGNVLLIRAAAAQETSAPAPVDGGNVLKAVDVVARVHLDAGGGPDDGQFFTVAVTNDVATYA